MGKSKRNDIEMYFEWWLNELKDAGYIRKYGRELETYEIVPPYLMERKVRLKTKEKSETFALLPKIDYTPDYEIVWEEKSMYVLFQPVDFRDYRAVQTLHIPDTPFMAQYDDKQKAWVTLVDVKPPSQAARFNANMSSYHTFPVKQAILIWFHGVYVNKVIPIPMAGAGSTISLFPNTFTPKRYLFTDGQTRTRKIKWSITPLAKYITGREQFVRTQNALSAKFNQDSIGKQSKLFDNEYKS